VEAQVGQLGLTDEDCERVVLAVHEAVANALEHGTGCGQGDAHISLTRRATRLEACVSDCGSYHGPDALYAGMPRPGASRGRGLALIGELMDEVVIDRGPRGTAVRMTKWLSTPRPARRVRHRHQEERAV
jgi:serine/threonine-protein kinase RsbW